MRSNRYVLMFMSSITIVVGFLLSMAATALSERQERNVQIDMKKNILRSLDIPEDASKKLTADEIESLFETYIKTIEVNEMGNVVDADGQIVYVKVENDLETGYSIPISGKGLWSTIYGYLAIEPDGETVKGITFYRHGETPGLGGEIEKDWFTSNFKGKKIVTPDGVPCSIEIVKGMVEKGHPKEYCMVDGISGATMTTKGMNVFMDQDLKKYGEYLSSIREKN